jgi:hypothetical protein
MPNDRDDVDDESTGTKTIEQSAVESDTTEEECLIVELRLPTDALPFGEALSRLDGVRVEFEQIVPASENPLPYLWVDDGGHGGFEAAVSADPTVERIRHVSDLNGDGGLYELGWTDLESTLLEWFDGGDGTILQLDGEIDEWHVKMRVESRAASARSRSTAGNAASSSNWSGSTGSPSRRWGSSTSPRSSSRR